MISSLLHFVGLRPRVYYTLTNFRGGGGGQGPLGPPPSIRQCPFPPLSLSFLVVVVVDPLLPDYWGESASVVLWGFAASFSRQSSSRAATPEGSLHKSRESVVGICGQLKRCCVVCS